MRAFRRPGFIRNTVGREGGRGPTRVLYRNKLLGFGVYCCRVEFRESPHIGAWGEDSNGLHTLRLRVPD